MSAKVAMIFIKSTVVAIACSITLAPVSFAKHAAFELPACDRLMNGDGPGAKQAADPASSGANAFDLSPMKLTDDNNSYSVGKDGKMKARVEEDVKGASGGNRGNGSQSITDKPQSVIHDNSGDIS